MAGKRSSEITASSRTGHLQKGHGGAIGDWDRNGAADIFIELGGAIKGDTYHNVLFQNPGPGKNWLPPDTGAERRTCNYVSPHWPFEGDQL